MSETISQFVTTFQERLFAQSAYSDLMLKQAQWQQLRQAQTDTYARYLAQVINRYQDLDFVGIPELKDRQAMHIEDIFINLQAEVEVEPDDRYMLDVKTSGKSGRFLSGSFAHSTKIVPSDDYDVDVFVVDEATELDQAQFTQRAERGLRKTIKRRLALDAAMQAYPKMKGGMGCGM
ncbi:MAG TPA: hypothetical protein VGD99_22015 [Anaerolineae bacterium]